MPTGYTAKLHDGVDQTFQEFVLECAHAFGALVTLREHPMDASIPEFKPDTDYHDRELARARTELTELRSMSDEEAARRSHADYQKAAKARREAEQDRRAMESRYRTMLRQVEDWEPPTADHDGLKKFMRDQIEESIRFDCGMDYWPAARHLPGPAWREERITRAERDIAYHTEQRAKEIERTEGRNAWVRALRASLEVSKRG